MQTSAFLRPLPPHVCKCLQLGTPSPPKNCGRPLWTAPNLILKQHSSSNALVLSQDFSFLQSMIDFTKFFLEYMGINTFMSNISKLLRSWIIG